MLCIQLLGVSSTHQSSATTLTAYSLGSRGACQIHAFELVSDLSRAAAIQTTGVDSASWPLAVEKVNGGRGRRKTIRCSTPLSICTGLDYCSGPSYGHRPAHTVLGRCRQGQQIPPRPTLSRETSGKGRAISFRMGTKRRLWNPDIKLWRSMTQRSPRVQTLHLGWMK